MRSRAVALPVLRTASATAAILLASTTFSRAADRVWTGFGANGNFNVAANWSNQTAPGASGDTALFGYAAAARNVVYINTGPSLAGLAVLAPTAFGPYEFRGGGNQLGVNGQFTVGGTSTSMTSGASISANVVYVQKAAALSMDAARLLAIDAAVYGNLSLAGSSTFAASTVDVTEGAKLSVAGASSVTSANYVDVGSGLAGTLEVTGALSSLTAGGAFASRWALANGTATVTLANASTTTLNAGLQIAKFGAASQADVTVKTGASLTINGPLVVTGSATNDGSATVRIDDATLDATSSATFGARSDLLLSPGGRVSFAEGATFNAGAFLNVKEGANVIVSPGKMLTFDGGTATIQSDVYYPSNASSFRVRGNGDVESQGTFDLRTATLYVDGNGKVRNTSATQASTWANSGGWVARVDILDNATVSYRSGLTICGTGGAATVSQAGGLFKSSSLTVGGGASSSAFIYLDGGKFEHQSVELRRGATLHQTGGTWSDVRQLTMRDNSFLHMATGNELVLRVQAIALFDQARIDLGSNSAVIDYAGASPLATLTQYVRNAYNSGNWLGSGITSSAAALDPSMAIGTSDLGGVVTLRATLAGDADLDYAVDFDDLLLLASNYNQSGRTWQTGDFTYDGVVDFDDLLKLASNYNRTLTGTAAGGDWALARHSVPEPGTAIMELALAACAVIRRRRRSSARSGKPAR